MFYSTKIIIITIILKLTKSTFTQNQEYENPIDYQIHSFAVFFY